MEKKWQPIEPYSEIERISDEEFEEIRNRIEKSREMALSFRSFMGKGKKKNVK